MPSPHRPRTVRFSCRGHPAVRARHAKTLEFIRAAEIDPRATCVVGVAADYAPGEIARLRGGVTIELAAGGTRDRVAATVSPFPATGDSLVVRKSDQARGRTFATGADKGASGLDRALAAALRDPAARLEVTVTETGAPAGAAGRGGGGAAIVFDLPAEGLDPDPWCADALAAADRVVAADPAAARAALRRLGLERTVVAAGRADPPTAARDGQRPTSAEERAAPAGERSVDAEERAWLAGERVALAADPGLIASGVLADAVARALADGVPVAALTGPPAWRRALLASGLPSARLAVVAAAGAGKADLEAGAEALGRGPATLVLWGLGVSPRGALRAAAGRLGGARRACLGSGLGGAREELHRGSLDELLERFDPRARVALPVALVVAPDPAIDRAGAPAAAAKEAEAWEPLLAALVAEGVAPRRLAGALRRLPGWSRRRAYELAFSLGAGDDPEDGGV